MKKRRLATGLLAVLTLCGFAASARSQGLTKVVKVEVDEKEVKEEYKVFLGCDGVEYEARRESEGFVVPAEVKRCEKIGVRVVFGKYKLDFTELHRSKFETDWVIGVDNKPFSERNLGDEDKAQVKLIYYIRFQSHRGLDTELTIEIK